MIYALALSPSPSPLQGEGSDVRALGANPGWEAA
jgi:hypothetical protein